MLGDIFHSNNVDWPTDLVGQVFITQVLLIGNPEPKLVADSIESGIETRHLEPIRLQGIATGVTLFRSRGEWKLVISSIGENYEDIVDDGRQDYLENDDLLIRMVERYENMWLDAIHIGSSARFAIGDSVQILAEKVIGKIERIQIVQGQALYSILTNRGITQVRESDLLALSSVPGDPRTWINQPLASAENIALTLTAAKLRDPLTDVIYSFQTSRTLFRPYQFKPVLKMLMGQNQRLLIADEVGLGKTIEAGLIWSELEFRTSVESVLIVCPANLKRKWKNEMYNRFDKKIEDLTNDKLNEWLNALEKGRIEPIKAIATMEGLRTSPHLARLDKLSPRFDLVIVDEAHYFRNEFTRTHSLGRLLSDLADAMILLSATPLNLGNNDLFNLLNLLDETQFFDSAIFDKQLDPNRFLNEIARRIVERDVSSELLIEILQKIHKTDMASTIVSRSDYRALESILERGELTVADINQAKRHIAELNTLATIFTRTRKAETPEKRAVREPINVNVDWTPEEYATYSGIKNYFMQRALQLGQVPGFATQNLLRQAASCLPAMFRLMKEKYDFNQEEFSVEPADDTPEEKITEETSRMIEDLLLHFGRVPELKVDSKYERFEEEINKARSSRFGRQIIIFSFFRRTIDYLNLRLSASGFNVRVMHGGIPIEQRNLLMQQFRNGEFEILVCSEVGSEGLDFEFCDTLVNYDLPWNPMRVEQRIGRIDRFGQQAKRILIYNMRIPGTIEDDIFMRLYLRIGLFESSIGELEPILREDLREVTARILSPELSEEERQDEINRYAIAVESKKSQLDDLVNHQNLIGGVDSFLIEGFDEHTPGRGRFLGKNELLNVVHSYFDKKNGQIEKKDSDVWELIGSEQISSDLRKLVTNTKKFGDSTLSPAMLSRDLDGRKPGLVVTFDAELAARKGYELVSIKHPILECVMSDLEESELLLSRFGAIGIEGLDSGKNFLVGVHLARFNGERKKLEMWTTAVDIHTGQQDFKVGPLMLQALATNAINEAAFLQLDTYSLKSYSERIENLVAFRQLEESADFELDNKAIVSERNIAAKLSLTMKLESAHKTLEKVEAGNRDIRVVTMNKSRVERLEKQLKELDLKLEESRASLTVDAIAYVLVSGKKS